MIRLERNIINSWIDRNPMLNLKRTGAYLEYVAKFWNTVFDTPLRDIDQAYDKWLELQNKVDGYYDDKPRERTPLSQQKEFRAIKNAVISPTIHKVTAA